MLQSSVMVKNRLTTTTQVHQCGKWPTEMGMWQDRNTDEEALNPSYGRQESFRYKVIILPESWNMKKNLTSG